MALSIALALFAAFIWKIARTSLGRSAAAFVVAAQTAITLAQLAGLNVRAIVLVLCPAMALATMTVFVYELRRSA